MIQRFKTWWREVWIKRWIVDVADHPKAVFYELGRYRWHWVARFRAWWFCNISVDRDLMPVAHILDLRAVFYEQAKIYLDGIIKRDVK